MKYNKKINYSKNKHCKCGKLIMNNSKQCRKCRCNRINKLPHKINCECASCKSKRGEIKKENHPMYGKHHSEESRKKIKQNHQDLRGKNNGMYGVHRLGKDASGWMGGITKFRYPFKFNDKLKEKIRKRDRYKCQKCGLKQIKLKGFYKKLAVHHIDYNKQNCKSKNLITLCNNCNVKVNYNRDYWYSYFNYIIERIYNV